MQADILNKTIRLGFTGEYLDPVTCGYPLGSGYRWYIPGLMRFNAPDSFSPFGVGGVNSYAYCAGDPINNSDPSGHFPTSEISSEIEDVVNSSVNQVSRDTSIAAANAIEATPPQRVAGFSEGASTKVSSGMSTDQAATTIQRHWRGFRARRGLIPHAIKKLALSMGKRVEDGDEAFEGIEQGRILVESNGQIGLPLSKHSSFFFKIGVYELLATPLEEIDEMNATDAANFPDAEKFWAKYTAKAGPKNIESRAYIFGRTMHPGQFARDYDELIEHLASKGNLYMLDKKYSAYFKAAFRAEGSYFADQNHSYGLHYNCHYFVLSVLRRLFRAAN